MPKEKRIDCPALRMRSNSYPFGNRVPRTVRMLRTVTADPMPVTGFSYIKGDIPMAPVDEIFKVWTNSHGAVAAVLPNGTHLGLHPEEFEVETWHDLSTEATVGLVDFGFDDRTTKVTQEAYSIFLAREAASREKIDALQLRLNAADQRIDELVSAVRSINRGRRHEVFVPGDDEPQYRQRKEWVDWVLSLCDEASASDRCHEIPGTSGMRLNMLANQGE